MRQLLAMGLFFLTASLPVPSAAQSASPLVEGHEGDDYTRYELLSPDSASFRIIYEVTAIEPGARVFFNVIRKGSEASDEAVYDQMSGQALSFKVVTGGEARAGGLRNPDLEARYIQVTLPRPVPTGGEIRLRIEKTYKDAKSYYREGEAIVFARGLGIRRNAVVLPRGYELVACNVPSQVLTEGDGRLAVSFFHIGAGEAPLVVKARPLAKGAGAVSTRPGSGATPKGSASSAAARSPVNAPAPASIEERLDERAHQDREIVYFLQQPETHAFSLYHDYTERRPGMDKYFNVVRPGSRASNPSARLLDTGEALKIETVKASALTAAGVDIGEPAPPDADVLVIRYPAVQKGRSVRLRIMETYTDEGRYYLQGDELVWDRSLGRPRNAVVLPAGWYLTASAIPTVVTMTKDGRVRLEYDNPRPDELEVLIKARRRAP